MNDPPLVTRPRRTLRNFDAGRHFESFLTAAVAAVLVIRFSLHLTGYPQLGGSHYHVAHMLWGGMLMAVSIVLLLSLLDRGSVTLAAIAGGIGFGTFIDEVGKFVTRDNDYFFEPSIAVMYVAFILVFLAGRAIHTRGAYAAGEYRANALRILMEASVDGLDADSRSRVLHYLERADAEDPLAGELGGLLHQRAPSRVAQLRRLPRLRRALFSGYRRLTQLPGFTTAVVAFFVVQLIAKAALVAVLVFVRGFGNVALFDVRYVGSLAARVSKLDFAGWAEIGSSLLAGMLILAGIADMRRNRLLAYRWFERSTLVSIFITQVFMFYREQLSAVAGLTLHLAILAALRFMIQREEARRRVSSWAEESDAPPARLPSAGRTIQSSAR